jgi:uncharacterized protein (TIRG00374 family)
VLASVPSSLTRILVLAGCLASSVVGGWIALHGVGVRRLMNEASRADLRWLVVATAVFSGAIALRAVRWWVLFPRPRPPLRSTTLATLVGYLFNNVLPARAGEAARLVALRKTSDEPAGRIAGTIVCERILDTAVLVVLFLAAIPVTRHPVFSERVEVAAAIGMGTIVLVLAAVAYGWKRHTAGSLVVHERLQPPRWARPHLAALVDGLTAFSRDRSAAAAAIGLTLRSWVLLGLSSWLLLQGFDLRFSFACGLVIALATGLAMIIPSAPASLGVFEATTVLCLRGYPATHVQAVTYAVALHAMNVIPLIAAGAVASLAVVRIARAPSSAAQAPEPDSRPLQAASTTGR